MLRGVAFCSRVFVKFKSSGTVLHVCMYVCVYVYVHVFVSLFTSVCVSEHLYACMLHTSYNAVLEITIGYWPFFSIWLAKIYFDRSNLRNGQAIFDPYF